MRSLALVIRSRIAIQWRILWDARGLVLGILLALAGVFGLVIPVHPGLGWTLALIGVGASIVDLRRSRRRTKWVGRPSDTYSDIAKSLGASAHWVVSGGQVCAIFLDESKRLRTAAIEIRQSEPYRVDPRIKDLAFRFTAEQVRSGALWNDPALGLASDLPVGSEDAPVWVRVCDYLDHVGTDLLAAHDVQAGRSDIGFKGRELIVNPSGSLRPLKGSWLANLVGVSTLAFTSDGKLVTVWQAPKNYNSPALYAPSGSGALSPDDLLGADSLQHLVMNGANRELCEETGVEAREIADSFAIGYARWLSKGAMPEFYGYSLLTISSDELDVRAIPRDERRFTGERLTVRLPPIADWIPGVPESVLGDRAKSASLPLLCAIRVLSELMHVNDQSVSPLRQVLEGSRHSNRSGEGAIAGE